MNITYEDVGEMLNDMQEYFEDKNDGEIVTFISEWFDLTSNEADVLYDIYIGSL